MGTVVLNRKKRDKEHLYTCTEVISVVLQTTANSCRRGGRCGKVCRN
jgi:hypothetical protein